MEKSLNYLLWDNLFLLCLLHYLLGNIFLCLFILLLYPPIFLLELAGQLNPLMVLFYRGQPHSTIIVPSSALTFALRQNRHLSLRQNLSAGLLDENKRIPLWLDLLAYFLGVLWWRVVALSGAFVDGDTVPFCPPFEQGLKDELLHNIRFIFFTYFHLFLSKLKL